MAKLTAEERAAMPKTMFAIPEKAPGPGSYPLPTRSHAVNALARVAQHGSPSDISRVHAAVKRRFPDMGKHKFGKIMQMDSDSDGA